MKKISLIIVAVLGIALLSFAIAAPALAGELDLNRGGFGNSRGTQGGYGNSGALGTGLGIPVSQ